MTTHTKVTAEQLKDFSPVEGTWDSNIPSSDDRLASVVEQEIEDSILEQTGIDTKVQLFRSNGLSFHDECPDCGSFIATRK